MKFSVKLLTILFALALAATACGGGGGDDQAVIDAVAQTMREEGDVPEGLDVDCMSEAMVGGLGGAEGLENDYGITLEDIEAGTDVGDDINLSKDAARALTDDMMDCGVMELMVTEMAADMGEEPARCLVGELDQDLLRDMMAVELMNDADAAEIQSEAEMTLISSMFGAMGECDISLDALGG